MDSDEKSEEWEADEESQVESEKSHLSTSLLSLKTDDK